MTTSLERFEEKFIPEPMSGCWLWLAAAGRYSAFTYNKKPISGHKYSYKTFKGEIPENLVIDHLCKTPLCVNPDHLEIVTVKINTNRGKRMLRGGKTHCNHGHEFTPENTEYRKSGLKHCKKCRVKERQRYKQRKG